MPVPALRLELVTEDTALAARLAEPLSSHGYRLCAATNAEGVLERLQEAAPDVLLLDLEAGNASPAALLERAAAARHGVKTILLGGAADPSEIGSMLRLGACDYLGKPVAPEQLLASLHRIEHTLELERNHRRIEAQRETDGRRHRFLVDAAPDLIFMLDREGRFTFVNNQLRDIFDYDGERLIGKPWSALLEPALVEPLRHHVNERRSGDRATRHFEFDHRDREGRLRVIELTARGLYDTVDGGRVFSGTYGVLRDVTEPRQTSRVLAQSQQKFYGLFMNSPDAIFISHIDDGTLVEGNSSFAGMMAQMSDGEIITDDPIWGSGEERRSFIDGLQRSPGRYQRVLERHLEGERHFFEITARQLELDGRACLMASLKDLTAHKQAEHDRLNLEMRLQQASKMEAIGQLAGGIAHDFNNILASIIGYSELALETLPDDQPSIARSIEQVMDAGERARDLVSQLLTFTRTHRSNAEPTRIDARIEEVSRMLRAAIPKHIDIVTELDETLPPVHIDPIQLQQVVINLMINARDAIDGHGRIVLSAAPVTAAGRCVSCHGEYEAGYVALSVTDTGHGIADDRLPYLFDMFASTRQPGRGTGIGLWLIHGIVHGCGGHIEVTSSPEGTRFDILLPATSEAQQTAPGNAAPAIHRPAAATGRIVVIDDELSVARFCGEMLRSAGYEVLVFNDGAAACDHIRATSEAIGLILTDYAMPQVTGLEIARIAKAQTPALPVVALTGYAASMTSELHEHGLEALLEKPFPIDALLEVVRAHARPVNEGDEAAHRQA